MPMCIAVCWLTILLSVAGANHDGVDAVQVNISRTDAETIGEKVLNKDKKKCAYDDCDLCLTESEHWHDEGMKYTCDNSLEWCWWSRDMHRCCPKVCKADPMCSSEDCAKTRAPGHCVYPNAAGNSCNTVPPPTPQPTPNPTPAPTYAFKVKAKCWEIRNAQTYLATPHQKVGFCLDHIELFSDKACSVRLTPDAHSASSTSVGDVVNLFDKGNTSKGWCGKKFSPVEPFQQAIRVNFAKKVTVRCVRIQPSAEVRFAVCDARPKDLYEVSRKIKCECMSKWSSKEYKQRCTDVAGCPKKSCEGDDKRRWCLVQHSGCKEEQIDADSHWAYCGDNTPVSKIANNQRDCVCMNYWKDPTSKSDKCKSGVSGCPQKACDHGLPKHSGNGVETKPWCVVETLGCPQEEQGQQGQHGGWFYCKPEFSMKLNCTGNDKKCETQVGWQDE